MKHVVDFESYIGGKFRDVLFISQIVKDAEIQRGTMGWLRNFNTVCKECTENSFGGFLRMSAVFRREGGGNTRTRITLSYV